MPVNERRRLAVWFVAWTVAISSVGSAAQLPPAAATTGVQVQSAEPSFERIELTAGRSRVLPTGFDVTKIAVTNPAIAGAVIVAKREVLIDTKAPGITSLILWECRAELTVEVVDGSPVRRCPAGADLRVQYDLVVGTGAPPLQQQIQQIFPGEDIHVSTTDEAVVLSGHASTNDIALKALEIAQASSSKLKVINMLQQPGGPGTQQVMLEVRFAEVDHTALLEVGASFLANRTYYQARTTTQQFPAPFIDESQAGQLGAGTQGVPKDKDQVLQVPDSPNVFFFLRPDGLLAMLKALRQRGKFQSLAEPNLIAYNGQEASFLAGGEFPIPMVQGNTGQVTIQFREFGVRLTFRPTIVGEAIRLKVRPEVSTIDFSNGLSLAGFRVPALRVRRAETDVELRDGQSFVIAGLLDNQSFEDRQSIPLLSSLPIIGHLFKSRAENATRTELLVLITPHLVRPLEPTEVPPLPVDPRSFVQPGAGLGSLLQGGGGLVDGPSPAAVGKEPKP